MPSTNAKPVRVVVVGSINMDLVVRCGQRPRPGQTVHGDEFFATPGGKGANQAVAAARLGAKCDMIGRVGDDVFARQLLRESDRAGVNSDEVIATPRCPSGVTVISVDRIGENAITIIAGANGRVSPDDVIAGESLIARADVMLLQLEIPLPAACEARRLAQRHGVLTLLDPAPVPERGLPGELFEVDLISPNQGEARQLTGEPLRSPAEAKLVASELIRRGARSVVMKLGDNGAVGIDRQGQLFEQPAYPVRVLDTTAAGDAFTAALAVAMAEGRSMPAALKMACAAGAIATTRMGAQQAMPSRSEVDQLTGSG